MGAFDYGNYKGVTRAGSDTRLGAAFVAIKKELVYNGFVGSIVVDTPVFGEAAVTQVKVFQAAKGLPVTGEVDSATARELFRKRTESVEDSYGFTRGTIGKLATHESGWDPVAIGQDDHDDTGMLQINLRIHSNVTKAQAFDPEFALNWSADYIQSNEDRIIKEIETLKAARASYNVGPEYAKRWMKASFPSSGGVFDSSGIDWFKRAYDYVSFIDSVKW